MARHRLTAVGIAMAGGLLLPASASAKRTYFEVTSLSGTAMADVRTVTAPCRETDTFSEVPYVEAGHYEVSFLYDRPVPTSRPTGSWGATDDGSVGPTFGGILKGKVTTRWTEELAFSRGLGEGLGCEVVRREHCEGTFPSWAEASVHVGPRGGEFEQTFKRGVRIEWPTASFFARGGPCAKYGAIAIARDVSPQSVAKLKPFRAPARGGRFALRLERSAAAEAGDGREIVATQDWSYDTTMRVRRRTFD